MAWRGVRSGYGPTPDVYNVQVTLPHGITANSGVLGPLAMVKTLIRAGGGRKLGASIGTQESR